MATRLSNPILRRGVRLLAPALLIFASGLPMASAQRSSDDLALKKDSILLGLDRDCREAATESLAGISQDAPAVVADFMARSLEPEVLCGCSVRHMRGALEGERIDPFDQSAVTDFASSAMSRCIQEGMIDHFRAYCDAMFVNFYGEATLSGPHAPAIAEFCDCTHTTLSRVPPEQFVSSMQLAIAAGQHDRGEGFLKDQQEGSITSAMVRCGILDLRRILIDAMNAPEAR
jgi:hypothetical protein